MLAGVFLLASFMGGMTHSIVAGFTRDVHRFWWWSAGALIAGIAGIAVWRRMRDVRRAARQRGSPPPT